MSVTVYTNDPVASETIAEGVGLEVEDGWLLVVDAEDVAIAAFAPGTVAKGMVDPTETAPADTPDAPVDSTSGPAEPPPTPSTADAPSTAGEAAPDTSPPSDATSPPPSSEAVPAEPSPIGFEPPIISA